MKNRITGGIPLLLSILVTAPLAGGCSDALLLRNRAGSETGVLFSGKDAGGEFSFRGVRTSAMKLDVGRLEASSAANEAVGFTIDRPPAFIAAPWTRNIDVFELAFRPKIEIPVTIWIIQGPFSQQRDHAYEACIRTSILWRDERMGVDFGEIQVIDSTGNPTAGSHAAFPNGDVGDSVWAPLRDDIGFLTGRLNVYWVDTVNGATTNGWSNFGAQIVMGRQTGEDLLIHEIGHAFSLKHTNTLSGFDVSGIMASNSNIRQFITEGQIFRAHLGPSSALNAVYNARPGGMTRMCSEYDNTALCPPIQKRLWADGAFPAN